MGCVHAFVSLCIDALDHEMKESITSALQEYKATLRSQRERISELEGDWQMLQDLNMALEEKVEELELKLRKATSARDILELKSTQLSEQLEGGTCMVHTCFRMQP